MLIDCLFGQSPEKYFLLIQAFFQTASKEDFPDGCA